MNHDFPRVLSTLRKERGLSQKKAASDLGVSQALLSHYEKGIRECGLNFVIKASSYYEVTCDFLLGRTSYRGGDITEGGPHGHIQTNFGAVSANFNRKLFTDAIHIVFGILEKINSEELIEESSLYLACSLYRLIRSFDYTNHSNPVSIEPSSSIFKTDSLHAHYQVEAVMLLCESSLQHQMASTATAELNPNQLEALCITKEAVMREFPAFAPSLFQIIEKVENSNPSHKD